MGIGQQSRNIGRFAITYPSIRDLPIRLTGTVFEHLLPSNAGPGYERQVM